MKSAKDAEAKGRETKIVRVIHFPQRNENEDTVIYISRNAKEAQAAPERTKKKKKKKQLTSLDPDVSSYSMAQSNEPGRDDSSDPSREPGAAEPLDFADLLMRLVAVAVGSTVMAASAAGLASMGLNRLSATISSFSRTSHSATLFVIFIAAFVLSAIPLVVFFIPSDDTRPRSKDRPKRIPKTPLDMADKAAQESKPLPKEERLALEVTPEPEPVGEPQKDATGPNKEEILANEVSPVDAAVAVTVDVDVGGVGEDTSAGMGTDQVTMMRFLGGALSSLKGSRPQLDPYNKFGVHLIIAGASDALGELHELTPDVRLRLTQETLKVLGTKGAAVTKFCDKLEEYTQEPRYLDMFLAGREAMNRVLAEEDTPYTELPKVMKSWNVPAAKNVSQSVITVMFTDMVGSTNITQARGDEMAQILVRTHNSIVRSALSDFDGREVKHTGDGIMASFVSAANAIDATIAIQRATTAQSKDLGLHLRIGLNSGEPIREENDLFGSTVQLAARICAKADADQILVSNVVRELCVGKPLQFISRGAFELKGVTDPQLLYEVVWSTDTADATQEAAPEAGLLEGQRAAPLRALGTLP